VSSARPPAAARQPPARAWEAIQGAVDIHVHVAPDLIPRRIDDVDLAHEFLEHGLRGFVLKSHYLPTAERARTVTRVAPGIEAVGSITLNHAVGGLNPVALEISARSGARVAWMPTVDAANEWSSRRPGAPPPAWGQVQDELRSKPGYPATISLIDGRGRLREAVLQCLEVVAAHDLVLATGHVGREEIFALVARARQMGVERVVVSHAEFPSIDLSAGEQVRLAGMGAYIEHCYTTAFTGKTEWATVFANVRAVGAERSVISTDLGQLANPPVAVGLADFAERLLRAGFSVGDVRRLAVVNPGQLLESRAVLEQAVQP
jgi:hypothetical protein